VIVRIAATPVSAADGPQLADEVLAAIGAVTRVDGDDEDPLDDARRRRFDPEQDGVEGD